MYPGSLFECSQAIVLTLTAFSEGEHFHGNIYHYHNNLLSSYLTYCCHGNICIDTNTAFVDLDHCSQLNLKFWTNLQQGLSGLAPTPVHTLTDANTLLTRLTGSQNLLPLTPHLNASVATEWKHFVLSQEDWVTQIYVPDMFYPMKGTFALPLVIMDCQLDQLVDPDPFVSKERPSKSQDILLHCPLAIRLATPSDVREGLDSLLFSIGLAHVSSYLEVLGGALSHAHKVGSH